MNAYSLIAASIDLSPARKEKLKTQLNTELKPVLRPVDFESFDLDRAFDIVARMSHLPK